MRQAKSWSGLHRLARLYGIQTAYVAQGRRFAAAQDSLIAILRTMGVSLHGEADVAEAHQTRRREILGRRLEPVLVAWRDRPCEMMLSWPSSVREERIRFTLEMEGGSEKNWTGHLSEWETTGKESGYSQKSVRLPTEIPIGYHRLIVESAEFCGRARLIAAPFRAYSANGPSEGGRKKGEGAQRGPLGQWGVFAPLYGIQSETSWGVGDLSDLERLMDWTSARGGRTFATLPLLASFLGAGGEAEPFESSPYSPVSRLFWNELYIDPRRTPEWDQCPEARRLVDSDGFEARLSSLRHAPQIDYRRAMSLKREVLDLLSECAHRLPERRRGLERFAETRPGAADYARFRAVGETQGRGWPDWPTRLRDGLIREGDYAEHARRLHLYVQWIASEQISSLANRADGTADSASLYLDLPLGSHPRGFDVWANQAQFCRDVSVGAPPDAVFTSGQNWSFPPLHPDESRESGHRYFAESVRFQMKQASILRIDHVMGLHRLFWIPNGMDGAQGVYVRYPHSELYAILSLESERNRTLLVGENLGVVPKSVDRSMTAHGLKKMYVLQYSLRDDASRPMQPVPRGAVASLNTHDTELFAGFWRGADIDRRIELGLLARDEAEIERETRAAHKRALQSFLLANRRLPLEVTRPASDASDEEIAVLEALLRHLMSETGLTLVSLEDLWLEPEPQNVPGSGDRWPNWKRKLKYSLKEMDALESVARILGAVSVQS